MNTTNPIRFGIIGCGTIAPTHAGAIRQIEKQSHGRDARLVAVCDPVEDRATGLGNAFQVQKVFRDFDTLLADPDIDAVCLCTPSGLHMTQAIAALKAGKHVISEKPMDVSSAVAESAVETALSSGLMLAVISQHRFDPATQIVKEAVAAGKLGRIVMANASVPWFRTQGYYDSGDWRGTWAMDGGGALMNQGVHTVDVLLYLAGNVSSLASYYGVAAAHERIEVEDVVAAALYFENGAVGTLSATTAAYDGFPARIELFGTEGSAIIEGDRLKVLQFKSGERHESEEAAPHAELVAKGGTAAARAEPVWGDSHREQFIDFIHAIRTGVKPVVDGGEGLRPLRVIEAVYRSARTGLPVNL